MAILGTVFFVTAAVQFASSVAPGWLGRVSATYDSFWPQGWGFFANSEDTDTLSVYRQDGESGPGASELPLFMSSENSWGLGRIAASRQDQAVILASLIPSGAWTDCATPITRACLSRLRESRVVNRYQAPLLCGNLLFVKARPWSPAHGGPKGGSPDSSSVAEAIVSCVY